MTPSSAAMALPSEGFSATKRRMVYLVVDFNCWNMMIWHQKKVVLWVSSDTLSSEGCGRGQSIF